MKEFRTTLALTESSVKISHDDKIVLMGSCFAQEMGEKMTRFHFDVCLNPFGILFNPFSLLNALRRIVAREYFTMDDLSSNGRLFYSFEHHGNYSGINPEKVLDGINNSIEQANHYLKSGRFLVITFGSAWVYRQISSGKIVANCHKFPQNLFSKELLTNQDISKEWIRIREELRIFNPNLEVIMSVSPVRYLRDGFSGNQLSKSHLLLAVNEICKMDNTTYFPSYEIQMDDLRDYRFYKADMLHPSAEAIQYIWDQFGKCHVQNDSLSLMQTMEKYLELAEHRPIFETAEETALRLDKAKRGLTALMENRKANR